MTYNPEREPRNRVRDGRVEHPLRPRRDARGRAGPRRPPRPPRAGRDRPAAGRAARRGDRDGLPRRQRHRRGAVRQDARGADRRVVPGRHRVCEGARHRRVRRRRRRVGHRHREGGEPLHDVSARRLPGLRQRADWPRDAGAGSAQAADRDSHHRGHRERDDRRQHLRPHAHAREDRHRQPTAQAHAGPARSRQHADDAAGRWRRRAASTS